MNTKTQDIIQAHQPRQMLDSLRFEIIGTIRRIEGDFAPLVEADFLESLKGHKRRQKIKICVRWLRMYGGGPCTR